LVCSRGNAAIISPLNETHLNYIPSAALVAGPAIPHPDPEHAMPLSHWNFLRADSVVAPNEDVSAAADAGTSDAEPYGARYPAARSFCRRTFTAGPEEPSFRVAPADAGAIDAAGAAACAGADPDTLALVAGPKNPAAGLMPFAAWYLARAARVAGPKYSDSLPADPGPLFATANPEPFSAIWSCRTSAPRAPTVRLRAKAYDARLPAVAALADPLAAAHRWPVRVLNIALPAQPASFAATVLALPFPYMIVYDPPPPPPPPEDPEDPPLETTADATENDME